MHLDLENNFNNILSKTYVWLHKRNISQLDIFKAQNPVLLSNENIFKWASMRETLSSGEGGGGGGCEQHRRRPACASAQSDQRLCYSLFGKYHM